MKQGTRATQTLIRHIDQNKADEYNLLYQAMTGTEVSYTPQQWVIFIGIGLADKPLVQKFSNNESFVNQAKAAVIAWEKLQERGRELGYPMKEDLKITDILEGWDEVHHEPFDPLNDETYDIEDDSPSAPILDTPPDDSPA